NAEGHMRMRREHCRTGWMSIFVYHGLDDDRSHHLPQGNLPPSFAQYIWMYRKYPIGYFDTVLFCLAIQFLVQSVEYPLARRSVVASLRVQSICILHRERRNAIDCQSVVPHSTIE